MVLDFIMLVITYTAGYMAVCVVTILSIISFYIHKHRSRITPLLVSTIGAATSVYILKNIFMVSRPINALYLESTYSFPSGHSALAVALYGFIFLTIWKHDKHHLKNKSLIFLGLLILTIPFSRIYLGVHYIEDVVVGFCIGLLWLFISQKLFPASLK